MQGKDDFSLIWREGALLFRERDIKIIKGVASYFNVMETIKVTSGEKDIHQQILITKIPILNALGECIGIAGSHINLSVSSVTSKSNFDSEGRLWFPGKGYNEYLTKREAQVLKLILIGKTAKQIVLILRISFRTVEDHTKQIQKKFQCTHKHEIYTMAVEYGIIHLLTDAITYNTELSLVKAS
jgi:DNA-binding CsgD family transcriptional regulator